MDKELLQEDWEMKIESTIKESREERERWIKDMQNRIRKRRERVVTDIKNTENLDEAVKILGEYAYEFAISYKIGAYTIE